MNTNFKEWMLKKESTNTTGFYTPGSGGQPTHSSQMGYAMNQPQSSQQMPSVPNGSVPWQVSFFQNWYNSNRGNWSDVMKAAQSDPNVKSFLAQVAKTLSQDGFGSQQPTINAYGDEEFDIEQPTRMGQFADQLENMVRKVVPNHGNRHRDPSHNPPQGARPASTISATGQSPEQGDMTQSHQGLTSMHSQLQDMQSKVQDHGTSQLIGVVRTLMLRIDDIERRLGSVTPAA